MRRYAQRLRQRARAREADPETGITPASAQTYYAIISGFLTWCVEDECLPTNPVLARRAKSELPDDTGERRLALSTVVLALGLIVVVALRIPGRVTE